VTTTRTSGGFLRQRDTELRELMDDPDCDPRRLERTLRRFTLINHLVAGWGGVYADHVRPALVAGGGRGRLLDVGCGGGDVLRALVRRARADGFDVTGHGIDPDERALAVARGAASPDGVSYRAAYSADLVREGDRFDVVVSNHVVHHLDADQLAALLSDSEALASRVALHSDIARSRAAYGLYAVGITPFAPGSLLRTDGLRSIRRSYTAHELAAVTPAEWRVEQPGAFRVLARWDAPEAPR
jgi:2-polyprenyl-3-methyl-5-hydroxy-6-metoxy-1,4-benzoquinol methylase